MSMQMLFGSGNQFPFRWWLLLLATFWLAQREQCVYIMYASNGNNVSDIESRLKNMILFIFMSLFLSVALVAISQRVTPFNPSWQMRYFLGLAAFRRSQTHTPRPESCWTRKDFFLFIRSAKNIQLILFMYSFHFPNLHVCSMLILHRTYKWWFYTVLPLHWTGDSPPNTHSNAN